MQKTGPVKYELMSTYRTLFSDTFAVTRCGYYGAPNYVLEPDEFALGAP